MKDKVKEGWVTNQVFGDLSQAWKLRCDDSVSDTEYEEDLRIFLKGMPPRGSGSGTTDPVGGWQKGFVPVAAPLRPASKGENETAWAVERSAAPGYKKIMNAFMNERLGPAGAFVCCS